MHTDDPAAIIIEWPGASIVPVPSIIGTAAVGAAVIGVVALIRIVASAFSVFIPVSHGGGAFHARSSWFV
jgi:hypothetical protein